MAEAKSYSDSSRESAEASANSASNSAVSAKAASASEEKASNSAEEAKAFKGNAEVSASNAKASEIASANSAKESKDNALSSTTAATTATSQAVIATKKAEEAKTSATQADESERVSITSANLAEAWAASTVSPDNIADAESTTGKTQSSRSWALFSKSKAQETSMSATNAKVSETNAKSSETKAKNSETNASQYKDSALESKNASAISASNASKSEINARASMNSASASSTSASTSATNAGVSEGHAATSETNAKQALAESQKIQKEIESALTKVTGFAKYAGSVDNYSDLPLTGMDTGDVWNIVNADAAHQIKAGDNVIWNGKAWDNLSGFVDLSNYPTNEDVAKAIVSTTYSGGTITFIHKDGSKSTATIGDTSHAIRADQDGDGNVITKTYYRMTDAAIVHQSFQNQINTKQDKLTFDSTPTANSNNPVTSDGIKKAIYTAKTATEAKIPTVDTSLDSTSENPIQNKIVKKALDKKLPALSESGDSSIRWINNSQIAVGELAGTRHAIIGQDVIGLEDGAMDKSIGFVSDNDGLYIGFADRSSSNIRLLMLGEKLQYGLATGTPINIATEDYVKSAIAAIASYDDTAF